MNIRITVTVANRQEATALAASLESLGWKPTDSSYARDVEVFLRGCDVKKFLEFARDFEISVAAMTAACAPTPADEAFQANPF